MENYASFIITFHGGSDTIAGGNHVNAGVCLCVLWLSIHFSRSVENRFESNGIKVKICMIRQSDCVALVQQRFLCFVYACVRLIHITFYYCYSLSKTELPEAHIPNSQKFSVLAQIKTHTLWFVVYRFFLSFDHFSPLERYKSRNELT